MAKRIPKRKQEILKKLTASKVYKFQEAMELLISLPLAKFTESVDVSLNLGVDPRKSDQAVRGSVVMPHGIGKSVRVAVFTQGANVELAKQAGADIVGLNDLADEVKAGKIEFDLAIATPDAMGTVGKLGSILGPRGLMPNPKVGTVTPNVANAVKNAKSGQVMYRTDKAGIIHCVIGKVNFEITKLKENLEWLLTEIRKVKPSSAKGVYMKKLTVTTTMGPGLTVDLASLQF